MTLLLVVVGGALGAPLRYLTDRALRARRDSDVPWGTFAVNVAGSLLLGLVTGAAATLPGGTGALLGTGFCGALTTYSTFGYETLRLVERRAYLLAAVNVTASIAAGLGAAFLGHAVGSALT